MSLKRRWKGFHLECELIQQAMTQLATQQQVQGLQEQLERFQKILDAQSAQSEPAMKKGKPPPRPRDHASAFI